MISRFAHALFIVSVASSAAWAQTPAISTLDAEHRLVFKELVEMNTSPMGGNVSRAARAMAVRLRSAGFAMRDVQVLGRTPACQNVVATLRGKDGSAKPVLLLAHLDAVPARRSEWVYDPYVLREQDGWFYGRGTLDNKAGASVIVANMMRWKREKFVPLHDVIAVLTCDEETTASEGIQWLLANVPRLKNADYALNTDAGGVYPTKGGKVVFDLQASEKVYASFELTARNPGGHSSLPRPDNAIYALSAALLRISRTVFPVMYNEVTRVAFERSAALEPGQLAEDLRAAGRGESAGDAVNRLSETPYLNSQLRTTCVATMLTGGHAENALPQSASATVNCRVFPGTPIADVERTLVAAVADTTVSVRLTYPPVPSPPSPLRDDIVPTVERVAREEWPNAVLIPGQSNGATDGLYLRNAGVPVYGVSALFLKPEDDRSHGLDERIPVTSLYRSREYWYRLVKTLLTPGTPRAL